MSDSSQVVVLQSIGAWLAPTMVWLYDQVTSLGPSVESHIVCEQTRGLDKFSLPNIRCLTSEFPLRSRLDRTLRKTGLRQAFTTKRTVLRQSRARLLHSHFGNYGWGDMGLATQAKIPHVITFYGMDVNKLPVNDPRWLPRYRQLFATASRFLCEGPHMAGCLMKMGCPADKVQVHHLGVRIRDIRYARRLRPADQPLRVLMCASFVEKKGLPDALDALAQLSPETPFQATLIGGPTGNPEHEGEKQAIEDRIRRHGFGDRLKMLGFLPYERLIEEAYRHDVFLSPSVTAHDGDTEGGAPVTIALMAATGIPIVATTHCDIPEIVEHERSALLAAEHGVPALTRHLRFMYDYPEAAASFGRAGRERMEEQFDCEVQGARLASIYHDVLRTRARQ